MWGIDPRLENPPREEREKLVIKPEGMERDWRSRFEGLDELNWELPERPSAPETEKLEERGEEIVLTVIEPPTEDVPTVRDPEGHLGAVAD